jgi:hypothetical protein
MDSLSIRQNELLLVGTEFINPTLSAGEAKNAFRGHLGFQMAHLASRPGFQGTCSLRKDSITDYFLRKKF